MRITYMNHQARSQPSYLYPHFEGGMHEVKELRLPSVEPRTSAAASRPTRNTAPVAMNFKVDAIGPVLETRDLK